MDLRNVRIELFFFSLSGIGGESNDLVPIRSLLKNKRKQVKYLLEQMP